MTYLYNTLHYYESKLRDRPALKRRLVYAVLGSLCETRVCWTLSESYQRYNVQLPSSTNSSSINASADVSVTPSAPLWVPDLEYYVMLVKRITDSILLKLKNFFHRLLIISTTREFSNIKIIFCNVDISFEIKMLD